MIATTSNDLLFEKIKFNNNELDSLIINDLIKESSEERERLFNLWERYRGEVPIKNKTMPDYYKKNNKLWNDFRYQIVQQGIGYFVGNPIGYVFDKTRYSMEQASTIEETIKIFNRINDIERLDGVTAEYSAVCGHGARLYYIDKNGILRTMNLDPWSVIWVQDPTIDRTVFAIVIYQVDYYDIQHKTYEKRWKCELYDDTTVTYYWEWKKSSFEIDPDESPNPAKHLFNHVPVIKFNNNTLNSSDIYPVESLIDAYDLLLSNAQDELDELRSCYLGITGGSITDDDLRKARASGVFQSPDGVTIAFITKNLPTTFYDSQTKKIRDNIFNLSSTLDWTDPVTQGNAESSLAKKIKFSSLENKVIQKERNFTKALYDQYVLLTDVWSIKKVPLNPWDMSFIFIRSIPQDIQYYATAGKTLEGQLSRESILALFPFVKDPAEEVRKLDGQKVEQPIDNNIEPEVI